MKIGGKKKEIAALKDALAAREEEIRQLKNSPSTGNTVSPAFSIPLLSRVLFQHNVGILVRPFDGNTVLLSSVAKEILSIQNDTIPWDTFKNAVLPEDRINLDRFVSEVRQSGKPAEVEIKIARSEGETREFRVISMFISVFMSPSDPKVMLCSIRDISRQDKLKRDLIKAKEKAEDGEKLKNTLLANISHEIRTPMNSIIGFSELLNIGNLPYEKRNEYVKTIKNQGVRILRMIDDVIELTRIETGRITIRKSPCNIDALLHEMMILFNKYKKSQSKDLLEIVINYPPKHGLEIYTDPGRLQQLLTNLLHNAVKFTEKGKVEIGYSPVNDGKIEFYVKDTGIGLSKELQKNIFSPFADEEIQGIRTDNPGLGLVISRNLIKLLGGKIWVESEPGQGSTFYFTIPYEEVPSSYNTLAPAEESELAVFSWKDKVILIAEDDVVNYRFLEALLQDKAVQILHASNGLQALELCKTISKIDLVLMDLRMPEMDGLEATKKIRAFNKKVPIIAQTAFVQENELEQCCEAGCDDYITKPIDIKEFLEKIDKYLRER
jgi:signal transduction histidine kinase/CheY-like chemotaxis protein